MARPLRIQRPNGRYHVTSRGNERRAIYRNDRDRLHFLELLGEMVERYGVQVHAYVLMDNHFHLLLQTPEANLSRAVQWLGVSYSVWFNRRHDRAGHLFQGRFKALIIEEHAGWQEVARYVHLNPVRIAAMKLDKHSRSLARVGSSAAPSPRLLAQRLALLRTYRWSSYRAYAGYCAAPLWLEQEPLGRLCGGRGRLERQRALREYTEQAVRQGGLEPPWSRLIGGLVLGTEAFARALQRQARGNAHEQTELRRLAPRVSWEDILRAIERVKDEKWDAFCQRYGDWGRDAALWLGRRHGRLTLGQLGERVGGVDYAAVAQAVTRFGKRLARETELRRIITKLENQLSTV
jgi:REP element-mobilizing transposase RayT